MSWNNGQQQNGGWQGNGQRQQPKIPQPGSGRLRKTQKTQPKSPDFRGLATVTIPIQQVQQLMAQAQAQGAAQLVVSISSWYDAAKQAPNGQMMPESWSLKVHPYDPNQQQGQGQQQMNYGSNGGYQHQPQANGGGQAPHYQQAPAPGHYAPQGGGGGGYAPAPGYTPPPNHGAPPGAPQGAPQAAPAPAWGGQPAGGQRPPAANGGAPGGFQGEQPPF